MRINVIDPSYLMDQHLIAEYGEIQNMMLPYYRKSMASKTPFDWTRVPKTYTLNKGHAIFFYNKMGFVVERFNSVVEEMHNRKFNTSITELDYSEVLKEHMNSYVVTNDDIRLNLKRIMARIFLKPKWYRYKGETINYIEFYNDFISKLNEI